MFVVLATYKYSWQKSKLHAHFLFKMSSFEDQFNVSYNAGILQRAVLDYLRNNHAGRSFSSAGGYLYQYIGSYSAYLEGAVSLIPTFLRKSQAVVRMGRISYRSVTSVLFKLLPAVLMDLAD